ncbi:TrmH family RNA methyltransferase [Candidatus Saccharibacteria bacterium]|nr:TrmH family RNA methyltransferase [Candidatus Saccharibacteria bacterium]
MRRLVLIVVNVRSAHNVGSLLRTADALAVEQVLLVGYTPYPKVKNDQRLPHIAERINRQVVKTALGAEKTVDWWHLNLASLPERLAELKTQGFQAVALEQTPTAQDLGRFKAAKRVCLLVGSEIGGLDPPVLAICDSVVQIPMLGRKDSLNVAVAAGIALYQLRVGS